MVFKVVLLLSVLAAALAVPAPEKEIDFTIHADPSARLVGATQAAEGSAPHMAVMTTGLILRSLTCGGSVVTANHILTAAHCIEAVYSWFSLSSSLRVTVGTNRWNSGGTTYAIASNFTHPNYLGNTYKNDIGILVTTTRILMTPLVQPIALSYDYIDGGVPVKVTGWGRIRSGGSLSAVLLEVETTTITGDECVDGVAQASVDLNVRAPPVEPHIEICTFHSEGVGNCNGDSGSALFLLENENEIGKQVGIVSWGFPCARGAPDMFARVSGFEDWLLDIIA